MNRSLVLSFFAALVVAQLAVPATMILRRESVIARGKEYKIHVQPVDPYDAFRGRYVQLGLVTTTVPTPDGESFKYRQKAYALLTTDAEGFAVVQSVSFTVPDAEDYLKVRLSPNVSGKANIIWPFDRYYMEESIAPEAERVYRQRSRSTSTYITVRISGGTGVITGLYLDGKRIEEVVAGR